MLQTYKSHYQIRGVAQLLLSAQKPSSSNRHCACVQGMTIFPDSHQGQSLPVPAFVPAANRSLLESGKQPRPSMLMSQDLPGFCSHHSISREENLEMSFPIPLPQFPCLKAGRIASISLIVFEMHKVLNIIILCSCCSKTAQNHQ